MFGDNEAVIKMIIKGRSPTMRHVSRSHRVSLDWSFDRINVDLEIQIGYIDSSSVNSPIASRSPGDTHGLKSADWIVREA